MSPKEILEWYTKLGMTINALRALDSQSGMLEKFYGLYSAYAFWIDYQQNKGVVSNPSYQNYIFTLINIMSKPYPSIIKSSDNLLTDIVCKCPSFELPFFMDDSQFKVKPIDNQTENIKCQLTFPVTTTNFADL